MAQFNIKDIYFRLIKEQLQTNTIQLEAYNMQNPIPYSDYFDSSWGEGKNVFGTFNLLEFMLSFYVPDQTQFIKKINEYLKPFFKRGNTYPIFFNIANQPNQPTIINTETQLKINRDGKSENVILPKEPINPNYIYYITAKKYAKVNLQEGFFHGQNYGKSICAHPGEYLFITQTRTQLQIINHLDFLVVIKHLWRILNNYFTHIDPSQMIKINPLIYQKDKDLGFMNIFFTNCHYQSLASGDFSSDDIKRLEDNYANYLKTIDETLYIIDTYPPFLQHINTDQQLVTYFSTPAPAVASSPPMIPSSSPDTTSKTLKRESSLSSLPSEHQDVQKKQKPNEYGLTQPISSGTSKLLSGTSISREPRRKVSILPKGTLILPPGKPSKKKYYDKYLKYKQKYLLLKNTL